MDRLSVGEAVIELVQGDITDESTDAIVNAANSGLRGGGGVDGAIHRAGGPSILEECRKLGGCPTGGAVVTGGGRLRAKHVIHAVGPRYRGREEDAALLAGAYRESMNRAAGIGAESVAFPSISTGIYGYPIGEAARIALREVRDSLRRHPGVRRARFVLFSAQDFQVYCRALEDLSRERE